MDSVADYICWKKVSKLDRAVEFKQRKKWGAGLWNLWDKIKQTICDRSSRRRENQGRKHIKKKKKWLETSLTGERNRQSTSRKLREFERSWILRDSLKHIAIKLWKVKEKKRILKAAKGKQLGLHIQNT